MSEDQRIAIGPELFPMAFKDVASGVYFTELKYPTDGVVSSVEVVVDSNLIGAVRDSPHLFKRLGWILGCGTTVHINVAFFAFEQFISNRRSALQKLKDLTEHPALLGTFKPGFAESFFADVAAGESDVRRLIGTLAIYLFTLRALFEKKIPVDEKLRQWRSIFQEDVPKLAVVYLLGLLFLHAQANPRLSFNASDRKVQDWANQFLSVRAKEDGDPGRWARNRLFDLIPFYTAPVLNMEATGGKPGRLMVATKDVYSAECLYRLFAFHGEQQQDEPWSVILNFECLRPQGEPLIEELRNERLQTRSVQSVEERRKRVQTLIDLALPILDAGQADLLRALDEFELWTWLGSAS